MDDRGRGLEFLIGEYGVVVPAAFVDRVIESELSPPPPLARPWLGGFGQNDGLVFATIDLAGESGESVQRRRVGAGKLATCVLLETGKTMLRWALHVSRTVGFVEMTRCGRPRSIPPDWPSWIEGARIVGKSTAGLLDVAGMARDFEK